MGTKITLLNKSIFERQVLMEQLNIHRSVLQKSAKKNRAWHTQKNGKLLQICYNLLECLLHDLRFLHIVDKICHEIKLIACNSTCFLFPLNYTFQHSYPNEYFLQSSMKCFCLHIVDKICLEINSKFSNTHIQMNVFCSLL